MPYAVTHILIAIIAAEIIRDYIVKDKRKFPLHYVLIAGIAGLLPDIDVLFVYSARALGIVAEKALELHASFTHSFLWVGIFLLAAFMVLGIEKEYGKSKGVKWLEKGFTKHHLKISGILFIIALGILIHLSLDFLIAGQARLLFFSEPFGLNLIPEGRFGNMIAAGVDAVLLLGWLIHEELKHKISDFI